MIRPENSALFALRSAIAANQSVYVAAARVLGNRQLCDKRHDIVIDGYPRSANSTAEAAFRVSQGSHVRIAHHCYAPAQFLRAKRLRKPAVLLFRDPDAAVLSYKEALDDTARFDALFRAYVAFYEPLLPHMASYVAKSFGDVVDDFGSVVRRVNRRFDTRFQVPEQSTAFEKAVEHERNRLSRERTGSLPRYSRGHSAAFARWRADRQARLASEMKADGLADVRERAKGVYAALCEAHAAQLRTLEREAQHA